MDLSLGAFFFGGVEMDDAGAGPPGADGPPLHERADVEGDHGLRRARRSRPSGSGYDSFWTTEHHFQYEGYEVIPNGIQLSTWIAAQHRSGSGSARCSTSCRSGTRCASPRTSRRCTTCPAGAASSASGAARCRARSCTSTTRACRSARHDNPDQAADDDRNRRVFEESMEIVRLALADESFSYHGELFQLPVPGIPDRGSTVQQLTLVPRPLHPYEIWQAVTSPPTLDYVPVVGHGAVFWNQHHVVHQALLGHATASATRRPTTARSSADHEQADARRRRAHRGHPREGRSRRRRPATTSSGSSSGRTAGAAATWARTASRPRPG